MRRLTLSILGLGATALAAVSAAGAPPQSGAGNPSQGAIEIVKAGCGSCHQIPGIAGARGEVGPPLSGIARRGYIAGMLPNNPENLARWIAHPQAVVPGNVMPDMGLADSQAGDIAAYLLTLK